jgi:hypothetical protein
MHGCKTFEIDSNHHLMEVHDDIQKESTFFLFRKKNWLKLWIRNADYSSRLLLSIEGTTRMREQRKHTQRYNNINSNMNSFFRFVNKQASYPFGIIPLAHAPCDWLFHWQHKLCATFSAKVDINYRLPIKVYYCICTLTHIRIEINHGNQNVFWVLTWIAGY